MDGFAAQSGQQTQQHGNNPIRPPFPRALSRSSNARAASPSNNSSSSNLGGSSSSLKSSSTHSASHRYHHQTSSHAREAAAAAAAAAYPDRPRSQLSRRTSNHAKMGDAGRASTPPVSSFLQERLQRERRFEVERSASRMSSGGDLLSMSASGELRAVQSSPIRERGSDVRRPGSSGGSAAEQPKKTGLGLKEMEQTVSTLHKQNFDLKLELFHRREKQTELEERLERLEADKGQVEEMNDQLLHELEKRDKAVEEAVAMIVVLEARVEQLFKEREMVRQVDAEGLLFYAHREGQGSGVHVDVDVATPRKATLDLPSMSSGLQHDPSVLARMPSFLSEQSGHTENLRNVYLGVRGSVISLPKTGEEGADEGAGHANGMTSPSLSMLSESSFLSVYGQKQPADLSEVPAEELPMLDGPVEKLAGVGLETEMGNASRSRWETSTKPKRQNSQTRGGNAPPAFPSIHDMLDSGSPLQRLENLDKTVIAMDDASRPTAGEDVSNPAAAEPRVQKTRPQQPMTREEKREALRKVLTDPAYMKDFQNPHAFPPTPDTVSTSMLRRGGQNSDDTLANQRVVSHERSYLALSEEGTSTKSASQERFVEVVAPATDDDNSPKHITAAQPPTTAPLFSSSKRAFTGMTGGGSYFDSRIPPATQQQRPRSADESTISHRRGATRGPNGWDTDSSADDDDDVVSGYDYWLRESLRPSRGKNLGSSSAHPQHHGGAGSRAGHVSPDLFSFPSSGRSGGWASDAIFGLLGGSGYLGSTGAVAGGAPLAQTLDALGASLPHPQAGFYGSGLASNLWGGDDAVGSAFVQPPPPPNRLSSLHARTGSMSASGSGAATTPVRHNHPVRKSPARVAPGVSRRNSAESSAGPHGRTQSLGGSSHHQPQQQQQDAHPAAPKQRHYPPISNAGQAVRGRGLSNFFRRSTGGSPASVDVPAPPASAPPAETLFPVPASSNTAVAAAAKSGAAQGGGGGGGGGGSHAGSPVISLVGVPSWGRRADLGATGADDERDSATPPPILRNRVPGRASVSAAAADEGSSTCAAPALDFEEHQGGALLTPEEKDHPAAVPIAGRHDVGGPADGVGGGGGGDAGSAAVEAGRRRWFGLGRKASLRK